MSPTTVANLGQLETANWHTRWAALVSFQRRCFSASPVRLLGRHLHVQRHSSHWVKQDYVEIHLRYNTMPPTYLLSYLIAVVFCCWIWGLKKKVG